MINFRKTAIAVALVSSTGFPAVSSYAAVALEEIVVTAQRRAESIMDVPIAIVAVSGDQMEAAGVQSFKDISMISSGVQVNDPSGYVFPFLRGIGSFAQSGSTNSSVAVYMDGVFLPRLSSTALELDNIEQVEILKGPQATLYGRNATGGTIKITTKTAMPGDELEGKISATVGDYSHQRVNFFVSGGISDTLAANITGSFVERDGFNKNLAPANNNLFFGSPAKGKNLDNTDSQYINAKITWQPTENLQVVLSAFDSKFEGTASSGLVQLNPEVIGPLLIGGFGVPAEFVQFPTKEHETFGHSEVSEGGGTGGSLKITYEGDKYSFTSVTAKERVDFSASSDVIATAIPIFGFQGHQDSKTFSQDFQLSAIDGEGIDWMVGANYFEEEGDPNEELYGLSPGLASLSSRVAWDVEATSFFGELYYDLTDKLSLTLGVRYTEETFSATPLVDFIAPPELLGVEQSIDDDATTYRVVLDYATDWGLIYGSISTGFKSGGLVTANVTGGPYDAEELTAYEIGTKATLADGRVQLNAAAFMYDFTKIQSQIVGGPSGGALFFVAGDEADLSGVEVELLSQITERFSLQAGFTYLIDHEYVDFFIPANASTVTPEVNASGNDMVGAAELTVVLGAQYEVPLDGLGFLTFSTNINYNSGSYHDVSNFIGTGGVDDASYTRVNARISFMTEDEAWEVALWVNNLTDDYYFRSGLTTNLGGPGLDTKLGLPGQPRHYGLTAKYNF